MRHGGQALFSRRYTNLANLQTILITFLPRPLNTSATQDDILHVLKIVKPTHIVTIEEKLSTVQAALASLSVTNMKIMTVRCKVDNLPQVCSVP